MTNRRLTILILAAVGLVAAGCGSSDSVLTGTTSTTGTDVTTTGTTSTGTTTTGTTATTSTGSGPTTSVEGTTFTDPAGKYSIVVPPSWISAQDTPKAWFLDDKKDDFRENVNILTETIPSSLDLDSYVDLSISKAPGMIREFSVKQREKITLDSGQTAYRLVYTGSPNNVPAELSFTFLAVVAVEDGTAVTLTMTAPKETFEATVDKNWPAVRTLTVK